MKLGLIGCGKMGSALIEGILHSCNEEKIPVGLCDTYAPSAEVLGKRLSALDCETKIHDNVESLVQEADAVLLCVKPNDVPRVLSASQQWAGKLLLSIAAGITINDLEKHTRNEARVIRIMPNTPALIGEAASAFSLGSLSTSEDASFAHRLLSSVGSVCEVKESLMDAVTGLSGSGPAYGYMIIEALSDAGVKKGLPRDIALELACQTIKGAAMMIQHTQQHPAVLKDQVTSPGGTTITGLSELEERGLRSALISAVDKATEKSKELGQA